MLLPIFSFLLFSCSLSAMNNDELISQKAKELNKTVDEIQQLLKIRRSDMQRFFRLSSEYQWGPVPDSKDFITIEKQNNAELIRRYIFNPQTRCYIALNLDRNNFFAKENGSSKKRSYDCSSGKYNNDAV